MATPISPPAPAPAVHPMLPLRQASLWGQAKRQPRLLIGGGLIVLWLLVALFAPLIAPYSPTAIQVRQALSEPSAAHWLGTDDLGRDILSRSLYGARISLPVSVMAVLIGFSIGLSLGLPAGYWGGLFDILIMRLVDVLLAFPALILAIAITSALGPQIQNAMLAIGVVTIPVYARLARGQVLQVRQREYVEAARALGASHGRIIVRHILPNILNPLIVQASLSVALAILAEAGLSFLGLGAQPPTPTWGFDLNHARSYLLSNAWMGVGPGLSLLSVTFGFNLLGESLRDLLDPRLRRLG